MKEEDLFATYMGHHHRHANESNRQYWERIIKEFKTNNDPTRSELEAAKMALSEMCCAVGENPVDFLNRLYTQACRAYKGDQINESDLILKATAALPADLVRLYKSAAPCQTHLVRVQKPYQDFVHHTQPRGSTASCPDAIGSAGCSCWYVRWFQSESVGGASAQSVA
jgi:hypothetical protein